MKHMNMFAISALAAGAWIAEAIKLIMGMQSDFSFLIGVMLVWFLVFAWRELK